MMALSKFYTRINWKNRPSTSTPLGESNLNHMDSAVDELDNRIVTMDAEKLGRSEAQNLCNGIDYDVESGVFVFHYMNGGTKRVDLNVEKIPVNMSLSDDGILTITNTDGTTYKANIASLLVTINFRDSEEIDFQISDSGKIRTVTAVIKSGSITADKLDPAIQGEIRNDRILAQTAASDAQTHSMDAKRYAVGGVITADAEDNAKYYCEKAGEAKASAEESASGAAASKNAAAASQFAARASETAAKESETAAADSQSAAHTSALNASASETAAATSESRARASENAARVSEEAAKASEMEASESQASAALSASGAAASAAEAKSWAQKAEEVSDVSLATDEMAGIVKGNPDEISVDEDGILTIKTSFTEQEDLSEITGKEDKKTFFGKLVKAVSSLIEHITDRSNPHQVTKEQIGLGNASNIADSDKSVAEAVKAAKDSEGQNISKTYVKSFSIAGRTIIYMKGDGSTGSLENAVTALVDNLLTMEAGKAALDATMGKVLADKDAELEAAIAALNGNLGLIGTVYNSGWESTSIPSTNVMTDYVTLENIPAGKYIACCRAYTISALTYGLMVNGNAILYTNKTGSTTVFTYFCNIGTTSKVSLAAKGVVDGALCDGDIILVRIG